jgi:outer membrane receptor for ferrienterochelin and colicin
MELKHKGYLLIVWLLLFLIGQHSAQAQTIKGYVIEEAGAKNIALSGAVVKQLRTANGTTTNEKGFFQLDGLNAQTDTLVVSLLGFKPDTVALKGRTLLTISLTNQSLTEVEINARKATKLDLTPMNLEVITSADLVKDACCNLSETFENSATVDVSYSDAVSGAKEIRMLGLDGVYAQIMVENMPAIRTLGNTFGMAYIPGPWMSSIQVNKGAGSVVNGYESMSGQINVELKKPDNTERLFVNLFLNQDMRTELNIISAHQVKERLSFLTAAHGQLNWLKMDMNHDHYIDNPLIQNINLLNRITYNLKQGGMLMLAATVSLEDRRGGGTHFDFKRNKEVQNDFGLRLNTQRVDVMAKSGFVLNQQSYLGIQYKYNYHHQKGFIGKRNYAANEHFGYFNAIFQHEWTEAHTLKMGVSMQTNQVNEQLDSIRLNRLEIVPGMFAEGAFNFLENKVMLVGGLRVDYHNLYSVFVSPRANVKWNIVDNLSLRLSAGKGYRVASIFAENFGWLANNREVQVQRDLQPEQAWNYGANLTYKFMIGFREASISADYYRTDFQNQVVADLENTRLLQFYNLSGKSFANAFQIDINYEVIKRFDVKVAYKFEQTKTDYKDGRKIYPLRPQHRGLLGLSYTTPKEHWRFNTSLNWFGKTRIPSTAVNDLANQRSLQSRDWVQLNAQITFKWKAWEVYIGGENLINFIQPQPIIAGEQAMNEQFDASLVWGPLRGAMAYAGFRYSLPSKGK